MKKLFAVISYDAPNCTFLEFTKLAKSIDRTIAYIGGDRNHETVELGWCNEVEIQQIKKLLVENNVFSEMRMYGNDHDRAITHVFKVDHMDGGTFGREYTEPTSVIGLFDYHRGLLVDTTQAQQIALENCKILQHHHSLLVVAEINDSYGYTKYLVNTQTGLSSRLRYDGVEINPVLHYFNAEIEGVVTTSLQEEDFNNDQKLWQGSVAEYNLMYEDHTNHLIFDDFGDRDYPFDDLEFYEDSKPELFRQLFKPEKYNLICAYTNTTATDLEHSLTVHMEFVHKRVKIDLTYSARAVAESIGIDKFTGVLAHDVRFKKSSDGSSLWLNMQINKIKGLPKDVSKKDIQDFFTSNPHFNHMKNNFTNENLPLMRMAFGGTVKQFGFSNEMTMETLPF